MTSTFITALIALFIVYLFGKVKSPGSLLKARIATLVVGMFFLTASFYAVMHYNVEPTSPTGELMLSFTAAIFGGIILDLMFRKVKSKNLR